METQFDEEFQETVPKKPVNGPVSPCQVCRHSSDGEWCMFWGTFVGLKAGGCEKFQWWSASTKKLYNYLDILEERIERLETYVTELMENSNGMDGY